MTDHKAEAEHMLIGWNELVNSYEGWQQTSVAEAQVHATLYLAEQQRAANVIAAFQHFGWRNVLGINPLEGEELPEAVRSLLALGGD